MGLRDIVKVIDKRSFPLTLTNSKGKGKGKGRGEGMSCAASTSEWNRNGDTIAHKTKELSFGDKRL